MNVDLDTPPSYTDLFVDILDPNNLQGWGVNAIVRHLFIDRVNADQAITFNTNNDIAGALPSGSYQAKAYQGMTATYDMKIQGTGLEFDQPQDIAVDADGNIYVASYNNGCIMKMNTSGTMLIKFGCSYMTDAILQPKGVAVATDGSIYVSANDGTGSYRIEKWSSAGILVTRSFITGANVVSAMGLGIDRGVTGEVLYISGCTVATSFCRYRIDTATYIDTWAAGANAYDVDVIQGGGKIYAANGTAVDVRTNDWATNICTAAVGQTTYGVTVDVYGYFYISQIGNDRITKYNSACGGGVNYGTTGSLSGEFVNPWGVVVISNSATLNKVYVADSGNNRIKVVQDTLTLPNIPFAKPTDIGRDGSGNVYVANKDNGCVIKMTNAGVYTLKFGCGTIIRPLGVAVDYTAGVAYVSAEDGAGSYRIETWNPNTGAVINNTYITGANVANAKGLAIDRHANRLYIAGCPTATSFCRYNLATGLIVDSWDSGTTAYDIDVVQNNGNIFAVSDDDLYLLSTAWAVSSSSDVGTGPARGVVAVDASTVHVSNYGDNNIKKYGVSTGILVPQYSFGSAGTGNNNFYAPWGVMVNIASTTVYVADSVNNRFELITDNGSVAPSKEFSTPTDVAVDATTSLYVANYDKGCVHKIVGTTGALTLQFGCSHQANFIIHPLGVAVDSAGNIYVSADDGTGAYRIEKYTTAGAVVSRTYITGANVTNAKGLGIDRTVSPNRLYIAGCPNATSYCRYNLTTGAIIDSYDSGATAYDVAAIPNNGNIYGVSGNTLNLLSTAWAPLTSAAVGTAPIRGVALDSTGSVYVTSQGDDLIKKYNVVNSNLIQQISYGSLGTGNANFTDPWGVAVFAASTTVFVADSGNNRIKTLNETAPSKEITTPTDVAIDATNSIYIANSGKGCIQKLVETTGALTFEFGCSNAGNPILTPLGVAVDSNGNIYVSANDGTGAYRIEKYTSTGVVSNRTYITGANVANAKGLGIDRTVSPNRLYIAGCPNANSYCRYRLDTGAFIDSWNSGATAYDVDVIPNNGNIYGVSVDTLNILTTAWAGYASGTVGASPVRSVAVDSSGNAYVSIQGDDLIKKYNIINAALFEQYSYGSLGTGNDNFTDPWGIAVRASTNRVFVVDSGNNRIKLITETVPSKEFTTPSDVALDAAGAVYVANSNKGCVQKLTTAGALTFEFGCSHQANAIVAPLGVAVDSAGNIYVAANDGTGAYRIEKWSNAGAVINRSYITGANVAFAKGLGVDRTAAPNQLYIAGCPNATSFCRYNLTTGAMTDSWDSGATAYDVDVIAGGGNIYAISADTLYKRTTAWAASCSVDTGNTPARGVTVATTGIAYITNQDSDSLSRYDTSCALQYSFGSIGVGNDNFTDPWGLAVNAAGSLLYVSDSGNNRIKVVNIY